MAYEKTVWVSGSTPCSAANFNHMETGIAEAHESVNEQTKNIIVVSEVKNGDGQNFCYLDNTPSGYHVAAAYNGDYDACPTLHIKSVALQQGRWIAFFESTMPTTAHYRINSVCVRPGAFI